MPATPTSKAVLAAPNVTSQWHLKRLHRRLDDRDSVLETALQLIEEWDAAVFPVIAKVAGFEPSKAATSGNVTVSISGADFTADSVVTATLGTTALTVTKNAGAQTLTLAGAGIETAVNAASPGDQLVLLVRIDNVLCPPVALTPVTA
jgi:hypothetical protein